VSVLRNDLTCNVRQVVLPKTNVIISLRQTLFSRRDDLCFWWSISNQVFHRSICL